MRSRHRRRWRCIGIYVSYAHSTLFPALVSRFALCKRKRGRLGHSRAVYATSARASDGCFNGGGEVRCWRGNERRVGVPGSAQRPRGVVFEDAGCGWAFMFYEAIDDECALVCWVYNTLSCLVWRGLAIYVFSLVVWGRATRGRHDTRRCFVYA
ncbi:hypothetical protein B0H13DRAFT_2036528 [Mycena leptocephala]|nr:hypothetical protein B0H13DRAFT_2036528 [Mycena leptocephala]